MRKWEYQDWAQILETVLGFSGAPTCGHICPPGLWEPHNAFLPHWQDFCATENHGLTVILRPTEWGKPTESSQCPGQTLEEPGPNLTHRHFAPCSAAFPFYLKYLPLKNLEISHKSSYSQLLWKLERSGQTGPILPHGTDDQDGIAVSPFDNDAHPSVPASPSALHPDILPTGPCRHLS